MCRKILICGVFLLVATAAALAGPRDPWIHVRVEEQGPDGETVRVNMPLSLVEKILPLVEADNLRDGHVRIDGEHMDAVRLRAIWSAVREADEGEFVTVESRHENVRVMKQAGYLLIKVDEQREEGGEKVDVKIPLTVVDALLSGEGDELNLVAAIRALSLHGEGELITVIDDDSHVRIWVDADQTGGRGGDR